MGLVIFISLVTAISCGRSANRQLSQTNPSAPGSSATYDTSPALTVSLPTTNVQPNNFPVSFRNMTGEPIRLYYSTNGLDPDFSSDYFTHTQLLPPMGGVVPTNCTENTEYGIICIQNDTNVKWFTVDDANNVEETQSAVYRVRNAKLAVELLTQSATLNKGYHAIDSPNPSPVVVEYRLLFTGRMKVCFGQAGTVPGSPDINATAETSALDLNTVFELFAASADSDTPANLDDINCGGSGDFSELDSLATREGTSGFTFAELADRSFEITELLKPLTLQIPMKALHSHENVGTYKNHIYIFYEVLGTDGTVQGLTGKEIQIVTDIFPPGIGATLASGTYGNHRYVYLYSNDTANSIYYRMNGPASTITKADTLYQKTAPILIDKNTTLHFAAFDPGGTSSDTETNVYTLNLNTPGITATRFDGADYILAPASISGVSVRYPQSDLSGSGRLRLNINNNIEATNSIYIRAGGYTIQDALIAERESATTGLETSLNPGADFDPVTNCSTKACLIEFTPSDTDRYIDLEIDAFTKLEYLAISDYADLNPGGSGDPTAMQELDVHPTDTVNTDDDGTNAAFAPGMAGYLANEQKIETVKTIGVIQSGGNYDTSTEVFTGLNLRGQLLVEIKSIVSGIDSTRVFMEPGDLPINATTLSNADVDSVTKNARIDFDDLPEGLYPFDEEPLVITYKYLPAVYKEYYVYGDDSDPNTEVQTAFRSLAYEVVDQNITSILFKSNLLNLPEKYLDPTHPDYVAIRMLDMNFDGIASPASGTCAGQGWSVLVCAFEIMKAGDWTCNDGSPRNVSAGQKENPEDISFSAAASICPGEATLERQRISFQYLLTMTPENSNVDGTPLQGMLELTNMIIDIAAAIPGFTTSYTNQAGIFAELMNVETDEPFVGSQMVARSIKRNLLKTHPMTNDDDGSLPFLLSDALTDLTTVKTRLDFANSGVRTSSDNHLPLTGNQVARRDTTLVPNGTGYRGFLFQDIPPTEVMYNETTGDHNEFSLTVPANVRGTVNGGLSLRVDTTSGESNSERLALNPLNQDHLSVYPDPGTADTNGDGLRDCGSFSYYDGIAGCESDVSDPDNNMTGGANSVDQNGVGMLIDGLNPDLKTTFPFATGGIQDKDTANMSKIRNGGYGGMKAWSRGGIPTRTLNQSSSLDWLFDAPHTPDNSFPQGDGGIEIFPNNFPDTTWYGETFDQSGPQPYNKPYTIEYIVHQASWAQYHKVGKLSLDFELIIELGWIEIPIHMADIDREADGWVEMNIGMGDLIELIALVPGLGNLIPDDPIPESPFFLHDTMTAAAHQRLYDMATTTNGDDINAMFSIPDVPLGLTPTIVKNALMDNFTGPSGQTDFKGLAADIFSLQDDAPEIYVDVFETADSVTCAGGPSFPSVICEDQDKVLVFNTKTYVAYENIRWNAALHPVGQQCTPPDDNLFCGQKNWDVIGDAPDAYFYRRFDSGTLAEPMDSNGSGIGKERVVITSGGYLQIFDDTAGDYRNAEEYEMVEYYMELQNNLDGADRYIFRLLFTQPQTAADISFTWSRVK